MSDDEFAMRDLLAKHMAGCAAVPWFSVDEETRRAWRAAADLAVEIVRGASQAEVYELAVALNERESR